MRPRAAATLLLAFLATPALGGCLDFLDGLNRPDYAVSRTPLQPAPLWNTDPEFTVQVQQAEPVEVRIEAVPATGGQTLTASGLSDPAHPVTLTIPDGTWDVSYTVGGHDWETFENVRFDATPPAIAGLQTLGDAQEGSYVLGATATVEPGAAVQVVRQSTEEVVATALPAQLTGLGDGVHGFTVLATDPAGNEASWTVQVRSGSATQLPTPEYTFGIVARYTTEVRLWDLSELDAYLSPAAARAAEPSYATLDRRNGVDPQDPDVLAAVEEAGVEPGMSSAAVALALHRWMFDRLDYLEERLEEDDLLEPGETIRGGGGVCRDLAGLYVSLLRAAGVPARLVAGYLAGNVNGFHAWVEFYGGSVGGAPAWIPVDVSGIDGRIGEPGKGLATLLASFAIRVPEHLPLRPLTPAQEETEWSNAATLSYTAPASAPAPDATFENELTVAFQEAGVLCVDEGTLARRTAASSRGCSPGNKFIPDFVLRSQRVLDYGVDVRSAPKGTTFTLSLVHPEAALAEVEDVLFYGAAFHQDQEAGRAEASWSGQR